MMIVQNDNKLKKSGNQIPPFQSDYRSCAIASKNAARMPHNLSFWPTKSYNTTTYSALGISVHLLDKEHIPGLHC